MKFKMLLLIGLVCCYSLCCFAQSREFNFINYTQDNGLPSNESYFVFRDSRNYLWFATDQGVVRYNGTRMEKFNLPDNVVFKIYEDKKGRIWFFSHTGKLAYFYKEVIYPYKYNDRITSKFQSILITNAFVNDDDEIIINDAWRNIRISKEGAISSASLISKNLEDSSLFRITAVSSQAHRYFMQIIKGKELRLGPVTINLDAADNKTVIKTPSYQAFPQQYGCQSNDGKSFFLFYDKILTVVRPDGTYKSVEMPSTINCLEIDNNRIWVGLVKRGALLLDMELNIALSKATLADKSVTSARKDYEGGMWFSTLENGIFYLKNSQVKHLAGDTVLDRNVFCLAGETDTSFLFGTKEGVSRFADKAVSPVLRYTYTRMQQIFTDDQHNIFILGSSLLSKCNFAERRAVEDAYYKKAFLFHANSEGVYLKNHRFLTSSYYGLVFFDVDKQIKSNNVCLDYKIINNNGNPGFVFIDSKENCWQGNINALYRAASFQESRAQFRPGDSLFNKGVSCMRQLANDMYVIGIRFGGVVLMQDSTIIARITEKDGLLSNSVKSLLVLKDQVWVATANGISVISFKSYTPLQYSISNIGRNNGLHNVIINQLMPFGTSIIAATSNGMYEMEQAGTFLNTIPKPIYLYINRLKYYKGDTTGISTITLPYSNNRLVINYSAVCFNLAEELKYYYRFDSEDTIWHEIASTELLLENLIPGTYNLQIKASVSGEQRFSEVRHLQIIVEKAWWQNNWLKFAGGLLITLLGYLFFKMRVNRIYLREKQNALLQTKMLELEQTALRSQMNPHFIFNCLTSIQQLIISGNKTEANEYLVKFARLIRKTLELSGNSFITVAEEIDYIREYLALEQLRIPGQFEFDIDIDPDIPVNQTEIPGMMLQPIVENSIRHGIKHLEDRKGHIRISLRQQEDFIQCTVTDNGVGRGRHEEKDNSYFRQNKSYGMQIVARRLAAIAATQPAEKAIEITDLFNADGSPSGTNVTIQLPYKNNKS